MSEKMNIEQALLNAVRTGDIPAIQMAINAGANVNCIVPATPDFDDEAATPLILAISTGNIETVEFLLENGAIVDFAAEKGRTPLIAASRFQQRLDIAKTLIAHGANVNASDIIGRTPLIWAARDTDNFELAEYLLRSGATSLHQDSMGWTAMDYAEAVGREETMLEVLRASY